MDFALTLSNYCKEVEIIHRRDAFRADSYMITKVLTKTNILLSYNTQVTEIKKNEVRNNFELVTLKKDGSGELITNVDGIFYALGFNKRYLPCRVSGINHFACSARAVPKWLLLHGDGCNVALKCIEFLQKNI